MTTTPSAADSVAILGLSATHANKSLGVLTEFGFTPSIETTDIFTVANGKRELLRRIVTQVLLTMTFTTLSILDDEVTALFAGGPGGTLTFEATEGALIVTRKNAESGRPQQVFNIPSAAIRGTGLTGTPGAEASGYQFEAVALLAGDATDLGTIVNSTPAGLAGQQRKAAVQQALAEGNVTATEIDLSTISVDDAKAAVNSDKLPAQTMLDYEHEHKKRATLISFLESKLAAADETPATEPEVGAE